jgi:hypothetical protein
MANLVWHVMPKWPAAGRTHAVGAVVSIQWLKAA